jgi:hypothetical protein
MSAFSAPSPRCHKCRNELKSLPNLHSRLYWQAGNILPPGPFPTAAPETVGLSSERLRHLSTDLQSEVDRHRIPGAVIAVARKGRLAYYESLGFRDPEAKIPMPQRRDLLDRIDDQADGFGCRHDAPR